MIHSWKRDHFKIGFLIILMRKKKKMSSGRRWKGDISRHDKLNGVLTTRINDVVEKLLKALEDALRSSPEIAEDTSVYTGITGISLLYLHLYEVYRRRILERAEELIHQSLKKLRGRKSTFLLGDGGQLAIAAVVYDKLGQKKKSREYVTRLKSMKESILEDIPNELMNGRTGYLYALMFIRSYLGVEEMSDDIPDETAALVLELGRKFSAKKGISSPLMYEWHSKLYLGACHGLSGILTLLLQCPLKSVQTHTKDLIQPSVDYVQSLQFPSGNYPSSIGNDVDRLVHWCHGAPGIIHMLILAYKEFKEEKYLDSARRCSDVIWKYGLLKKGYGLCHGPAGNAYAFLALYQATDDHKQLYRACKFAEWCLDFGTHGCSVPSRPHSLFEGSAGTIYFLVDLLRPSKAKFPCLYI
ncbi:putative lanC-like protein 1 [Apostichopus japonicus]|uniref:Putative lanC-like protein 1 n=1 Tax=Stichopus japonicus TaxID=307972 RepID=A0A2G8JQ56_STIJA|nr:putative lanC-like protein 1 [Apostichopus japonicus]